MCLSSSVRCAHEIKHDGFRILARRDAAHVRVLTRNGNDFAERFPLIVAAVTALRHALALSIARPSSATRTG
jgi:ATP-dependent DNA ligase